VRVLFTKGMIAADFWRADGYRIGHALSTRVRTDSRLVGLFFLAAIALRVPVVSKAARSWRARAIPTSPAAQATSISIVHRVHRRPARELCCRGGEQGDECSPARSPMQGPATSISIVHSDPTRANSPSSCVARYGNDCAVFSGRTRKSRRDHCHSAQRSSTASFARVGCYGRSRSSCWSLP